MAEQQSSLASVEATVARHRLWFIVLGVALIVLGIVAIAFPFMTTVATKIVLGWLFLIAGIVQIVHAFAMQKWSGFFFSLLVAALYVIAGGWLAFFPLAGILTLTVFLAVMFIIQGLLEANMAFRMRPNNGWLWMLVAGIVAIAVGVLILAELPSSALWAIGLLVGVNLLSSGWAYLFFALAARSGTESSELRTADSG